MRKTWLVGLALIGTTVLSSCSVLDAVGTRERVTGTYELRAVNGVRLPAVIYQEPGYRLEVLNANFTLEADGTFSESGITRETVNGSVRTGSSSTYGFYDHSYGDITFDEDGGHRYYGTLSGNTLTIEDQGLTLTYQRF